MATSQIPASVSNVKALDDKRRAEYPVTMEIAGTSVYLKNAAGAIVAMGTTQDTTYSTATAATDGLMSSADKSKLNSLENYVLPQATDTTLGGVIITQATDSNSTTAVISAAAAAGIMEAAKGAGKSLDLTGTTLTLKDSEGKVLSTVTIPDTYTLPPATATTLGGVKAGTGVTVAADGTISVNLPTNAITLKGKVTAKTDLPTENNSAGDMYLVGTASPYVEFFWTGDSWEEFGVFSDSLDTSLLVLKSDFVTDEVFVSYMEA